MPKNKAERIKIHVQRGDVFGTANPQSRFLGKGINFFQKLSSKDAESIYGHSGLIVDDVGTTMECLWTIKQQNIFNDYGGCQVIIARPVLDMRDNIVSRETISNVIKKLKADYLGAFYPGWRLALHILPILAKNIHFIGKPVCSEFVALYLKEIGARYPRYWGVNPDTLADEWHTWKNFEIIFEGVILPDMRP